MQKQLFINGTWQVPKSGGMFDVIDSANHEVIPEGTDVLARLAVLDNGKPLPAAV